MTGLPLLKRFSNEFLFRVKVCFVDAKGERTQVKGKVGDNLLYLAHRYNIPLEGRLDCLLISGAYKLQLFSVALAAR